MWEPAKTDGTVKVAPNNATPFADAPIQTVLQLSVAVKAEEPEKPEPDDATDGPIRPEV